MPYHNAIPCPGDLKSLHDRPENLIHATYLTLLLSLLLASECIRFQIAWARNRIPQQHRRSQETHITKQQIRKYQSWTLTVKKKSTALCHITLQLLAQVICDLRRRDFLSRVAIIEQKILIMEQFLGFVAVDKGLESCKCCQRSDCLPDSSIT